MIRTNGIFQARRDQGREANDDGIALLSAILFMVVMAGLSLVLLSVIMAQLVPAATAQKRTQTINAAEAGLEATLGVIRSAKLAPNAAGVTYGDISDLPCSVSGKVDGTTTATTYTATVRYYKSDPSNQAETWLTTNKMACSTTAGVASQPLYALITSKGDGGLVRGVTATGASNRSVTAVYQFKVTNVNIPGGQILNTNKTFCLRATAATAGSGATFVDVNSCNIDATDLWVYSEDYRIKLASSLVGGARGLCLTGPIAQGQPTQDAILQPCVSATDPARWNQLWSWIGGGYWVGQKQDINSGQSTYCLSPDSTASNIAGRALKVRTGCNGAFDPTPKVGAGAASYATKQIVNYREFGRCADVTNENINYAHMISYPCKQDATGTGNQLKWNHKWYYSEPVGGLGRATDQPVKVFVDNVPSGEYCFQTPSASSGGKYPVFARCSSDNRQDWTRAGDTGTYYDSYLFIDTYGRCLTADSADTFSNLYSKITVAPCNGTSSQKWNAPATSNSSEVGGYRETAP